MAKQRMGKAKEVNVHELVREYWQSLEPEGSEQTKRLRSSEFRQPHPPSRKERSDS